MTIYILNPILLIFYAVILQPSKSLKRKKCYLFLSFLQLFLISSLRGYTVGTDLPAYYMFFNNRYGNQFVGFEVGYVALNVIVRFFTTNFHIFKSIVAFIILILFFLEVSRRSANAFISVLSYVLLFYYYHSFTALRQMLAFSILFFSLRYIERQEFKKFLLSILLASSMHLSSLIFAPIYFLSTIKLNLKTIIKYITVGTILWFSFELIKNKIFIFLPRYHGYFKANEYYSIATTSVLNLILRCTIVVCCFLFYHKVINRNISNQTLYHILCCLIVFQVFMFNNAILGRLTTYFWGFLILLFPEICEVQSSRFKHFVVTLCLILFLFLYFYIYLNFGAGSESGIFPYRLL